MRTKAHQFQCFVIWFRIDQDQIGSNMTISKTLSIIHQSVIMETLGQRLI